MASTTNTPSDSSHQFVQPSPETLQSATGATIPGQVSADKHKLSLHAKEFFYSIEEWEHIDLNTKDNEVLLGDPHNPIIRPGTKNIIEAPEKTFKTTMLLRLTIARAVRVLYMHGEMTPIELAERRKAGQFQIPAEAMAIGKVNFFDGRCISAHLIESKGQDDIRRVVKEFAPDVLVLDPWQSFIAGCEENAFKDVSQATRFLDALVSDDSGLTIFLVVHQGKNRDRHGMRSHGLSEPSCRKLGVA